MRYFYDTEFLEDGETIDLISIGIVAEDGREYYAVNLNADWPDMLAIIRAIHGRTIQPKPLLTSPKACETKYKES